MAGERLRRAARRALTLGFACAAVLLAGPGAGASAQGKLDRVSEAARDDDGHDDDEHDEHDPDDWYWSGEDDGDFFDDPLGTLIGWTVLAPFLLPRMALEDPGETGRFLEYPYREGPGYWRFASADPLEQPRRWSLRPRVEAGTDFDDLERFGLGLVLEHASRFGLDATWNRWREDLGGGATDELDLGDLNLVYRFAQGSSTAFRAGLGLNALDDELGSEFGFNTTYGVEFFPARPLTGALELDFGTLGDATQLHFRAELGFVLERFGLSATFDHFDIDDVELHSFGLALRGWM